MILYVGRWNRTYPSLISRNRTQSYRMIEVTRLDIAWFEITSWIKELVAEQRRSVESQRSCVKRASEVEPGTMQWDIVNGSS